MHCNNKGRPKKCIGITGGAFRYYPFSHNWSYGPIRGAPDDRLRHNNHTGVDFPVLDHRLRVISLF